MNGHADVKEAKRFLREHQIVIRRHWPPEQILQEAKELKQQLAASMRSGH